VSKCAIGGGFCNPSLIEVRLPRRQVHMGHGLSQPRTRMSRNITWPTLVLTSLGWGALLRAGFSPLHFSGYRIGRSEVARRYSSPISSPSQRVRTPLRLPALHSGENDAGVSLWERARVDPAADFGQDCPVRSVWGYGSLVFKPGFPHLRAYPACVRGFIRRFWQLSSDHRGTVEAPGRVVTLVRSDDEKAVWGVAYDVADEHWDDVLELLDIRERHGYVRTVADLFTEAHGAAGRAVVYHAHEPQSSTAFTGPEDVAVTAEVIATSRGPSGRNDEYLFSLKESLNDWGLPPDPYLELLADAVRKVQLAKAGP